MTALEVGGAILAVEFGLVAWALLFVALRRERSVHEKAQSTAPLGADPLEHRPPGPETAPAAAAATPDDPLGAAAGLADEVQDRAEGEDSRDTAGPCFELAE